MRRSSSALSTVLAVIAVVLLPAVSNIQANALPASWTPYLWVTWPTGLVLALPLVYFDVRQRQRERHQPGPALRAAQTAALNRTGTRPTADGRGPRHQLPMDTVLFGRDQQIADLIELATGTGAAGSPGTVVVSAIEGMPGIGKTALAVHASHLLAEDFPDGQLLVHLNAHAADTGPRDPAEALGQILVTLGVDPQAIPADVDERAKVYRDRLAGTRTLIVLDDAATEQQVRPLLPAESGCLVLVTSRNRLKALDDAHPMLLDVLAAPDAVALFVRYAGPGRVDAADPAVQQIAELCGYLPLALRITAVNLRHARTWSTEHLQHRLRAGLADLTAFDDGERQVAAAFDLSYNNLTADQQTMFRRLGLIPGPDTDAYAAANLQHTDPAQADRLLQHLTGRSLLIETTPGRYRLHDLLHIHARTRAEHDDTATDRDTAVDRLLDYYQHTAARANSHLEPRTPARPIPEPANLPRHTPALNNRQHAQAWLTAELANLIAAARHAATRPNPIHSITLPAALCAHLYTHGPWTQALDLHATAAHTALILHNHLWRANALNDLGVVRYQIGDHPGAQDVLQQALALYQDLGNRNGQAVTLSYLGAMRYLTGDHPGAEDAHCQALTLFRALGTRGNEAWALTFYAAVPLASGDVARALNLYRDALAMTREVQQPSSEALALEGIGECHLRTGEDKEGIAYLEQALEIFRRLGMRSDIPRIKARLAELPRPDV